MSKMTAFVKCYPYPYACLLAAQLLSIIFYGFMLIQRLVA
jgi:hypothetical protein